MKTASPAPLPTFEVDRDGLRKLLEGKSKTFVLAELVQNAWDQNVTTVDVELAWTPTPGVASIQVIDDDPDGFSNLAHAYTLFAESEKKGSATKRGRFNIGEKHVIALCEYVVVSTTSGTVRFDAAGRYHDDERRDRGSSFYAQLHLTADEYAELERFAERLIPPRGIETRFNGALLGVADPVRSFEATIGTVGGENLRTYDRKTTFELYPAFAVGEAAYVYEMGIPVVEVPLPWHVNVGQKVPLNTDRDNVTPAWLRDLCRVALEHAHDLLDEEEASEPWVAEALKDPATSAEAIGAAIRARFGALVVAYDPTDPEAGKIAASEGYVVLHGGHLPKEAWATVRANRIVLPAGQVTPSPKAYKPGGDDDRKTEPRERWTTGMARHAAFVRLLAKRVLNVDCDVVFVNDAACLNFSATYRRATVLGGPAQFEFNVRTLGRKWFDADPLSRECLSLTIHEFGHQRESDHLSRGYYRALTDIGAEIVAVALADPEFLRAAAATDEATLAVAEGRS